MGFSVEGTPQFVGDLEAEGLLLGAQSPCNLSRADPWRMPPRSLIRCCFLFVDVEWARGHVGRWWTKVRLDLFPGFPHAVQCGREYSCVRV